MVQPKKLNLKAFNTRGHNATPKFNSEASRISDDSIRISAFTEKSFHSVSQPASPKSTPIPKTLANPTLAAKPGHVKTVSVPSNSVILEKSLIRPGTSSEKPRENISPFTSNDYNLSQSALVKPLESAKNPKLLHEKKSRSSHSISVIYFLLE
jgi:hypothetical protein